MNFAPLDIKDRPSLDAIVKFEQRTDGEDWVGFIQRGTSFAVTWKKAKMVKKGTPGRWEQIKDHYEAWKAGHVIPDTGDSVMGWSGVNGAQAQHLINIGFPTIQLVAAMTDGQCQDAGMGGIKIRERAQAFLKEKADPTKLANEFAEIKLEKERLDERLAEQDRLMAEMRAQISDLAMEKKPGRPRKEATA